MLSVVRCLMRQTMSSGRLLQGNCDVAIGTELGLILMQPHADFLECAPVLNVDVDNRDVRVIVVHQEELDALITARAKAHGAVFHLVSTRSLSKTSSSEDNLHIRQTLHTATGVTALSWLT